MQINKNQGARVTLQSLRSLGHHLQILMLEDLIQLLRQTGQSVEAVFLVAQDALALEKKETE